MQLNDPALSKIDAQTRFQRARGLLPAEADFKLRTSNGAAQELTPEQRNQLEQLGVKISSEVGNITLCTIPTDRLDELCRLPFVSSIEAPKRLHFGRSNPLDTDLGLK